MSVVAFGLLPAEGRAVSDLALGAIARHAVHVHGSLSLTEVGARLGLLGIAEPELATDDPSIDDAPVGVADCAPDVVLVELNPTTCFVRATDKSNDICM